MSAEPDPVRLARALNEAGARYIVIGGFAVIAHQYVWATADTDLLVPADTDNVEPLRSAFERLDAVVARTGAAATDAQLADAAHLRLDTAAGRVVMLVGIGFVAILTAAAAERFMRSRREEERHMRAQLDEIVARLDAMDPRSQEQP